MASEETEHKLEQVIKHKNCAGCGACILFSNGSSKMIPTPHGPVPDLSSGEFTQEALEVCPGIGISYPELYETHYGNLPENLLYGHIQKVRIGHSASEGIRNKSASGGIITATLIYLLQKGYIDGAVCVKQGMPEPLEASSFIARSEEEIKGSMQSVYIPVSTLDRLKDFKPGEKYAMVCLPEQSAALRKLQSLKHPAALQVQYILGPYTGTALYPAAIHAFLRSKRISKKDPVTSLKWREGDWPGHLEIKTRSGKVVTSKKVYYNYLIPFFITHTSLRSMDFVNEFADLSVGDAWSPEYESQGKGFSVFITRTKKMESIISDMNDQHLINAEDVAEEKSIAMHGHMLDFKKRGSYLRNRMRAFFGHPVPDHGYRPIYISFSRKLTEMVISFILLLAGNRFSRAIMTIIPEKMIGPAFNYMRLRWKKISKPAKRKGLDTYQIKRI
ncbi:MAG: Coenzyme F420 hydrogenase/dehydrogenase, beta subunit C-terminal domain [Bacteroidales bacterium]|nr:Coenzyme F420 hydrogenase/dehydrogenase, beta subunit C-terminal domain [Bacteroidales bacterium]